MKRQDFARLERYPNGDIVDHLQRPPPADHETGRPTVTMTGQGYRNTKMNSE